MMLTFGFKPAFAFVVSGTTELQQAASQDRGKANTGTMSDVASSPLKVGKTPPGSPSKSRLQAPASPSKECPSHPTSPTKAQPQNASEEKRGEKPASQTKKKYRMICQCGSTKCRKYLF